MISFITSCKGRLHHLKQCLPTWISQNGFEIEVVVVDYDDPDNSFDYVFNLGNPMVRAVKAHDESGFFNLSKARNIGALNADDRADIFFFIDADAMLTNNNFLKSHIGDVLVGGSFLNGWGYGDGTGCCLIWRELFTRAKGYNENVDGWGFEDIDFYYRVERMGFHQKPFICCIETIKHSDADRVAYYQNKDLQYTNLQNIDRTKRNFISRIE